MPILNYTSQISVGRTMGQITEMLAKAGAHQIGTEYEGGIPTGLSFTIKVPGNRVSAFTLPVRADRVLKVMQEDTHVPRRFKTEDQAQRVAWRIIKDWLAAQLAIVETEMVSFEEVMLPYMRSKLGGSLYEAYLDSQLSDVLPELLP